MTYQLTDPQYAVGTSGTVRGWDVLTCDGSDEGVKVTFVAVVEVDDEDGDPMVALVVSGPDLGDLLRRHKHAVALVSNSPEIREGCVRAWKRWNDSFGVE